MFFQMKTPQNTQHNKWQQHKDSQPGIPLWNFGQTEYSKGLWDLKKKKSYMQCMRNYNPSGFSPTFEVERHLALSSNF